MRPCVPAIAIALALPIVAGAAHAAGSARQDSDRPAWVDAMKRVHARFSGRKGTFAQFGDSITVTQAFWSPLLYTRKNAPPEMERAFQMVKGYLQPECWRDWKGPEYGSEGGQTIRWALDNVDAWLKKLDPEVALIMFGTNDLHDLEPAEYGAKVRAVVQKCLDNGTVVLLSTIPPRHGVEQKAAAFARTARQIAREMKVPLTDFYAEIVTRRPDDWDGASDRFRDYQDYEVPTLLARDGVHPSYPAKYQGDYSEEALKRCGYGLRSYLVLMQYAQVIQKLGLARAAPEDPVVPAAANADATILHPPSQPWFPKAPPLPAPTGAIVRVSTPDDLLRALKDARPGTTILLADGLYRMPQYLEIKADHVTLRGASGDRERVILDGTATHGELIWVTACTGVTIADLAVQNVKWNGIKLNSETGVQKLTIYNCILHNIWQRAVKGVKVPEKDRETLRPTGCRVQYCLFYNDHPKQYADDPADTPQTFGGNYIGGIDLMYPRDWIISDNVFVGIHGRTREARGAVFLWHDAEGCVVERNVIIDCDSGVCLGNSFKPDDVAIHCVRCMVRNNFVTRAHENSLLADYTRDCRIVNNTVYDPGSNLGRLIRLVHDDDGLLVANNLLCGPPIRNEYASRITFRQNVEKDLTASLVAPAEGNLRLTALAVEAIGKGSPLPEVTDDIDHKPRGPRPSVGAYEFR